jgi:ATP/maltotriose-dependent transcriptional regulator MalT
MARQLDNRSLLSVGLRHLAFAALQQGDNVAARALHEEALTMARQAGNRREEAFALSMLGLWEAQEGDTTAASLLVDEALEAVQEAGDQGPQSTAYCARGIIAAREGQVGPAKASFEKGLELGRSSDHYLGVAMSLMQLGAMALARGDELEAREYARDCVTAAQNAGVRRLFAAALQFFAQVELHAHRYMQAVRVAAAETTWRKASPERQFLGLPWISGALELGEAQRYLGVAGYSREWSIGQQMTLEQAAALTREPAALEDLAADEPEPLSQGGIEGRPKVRLTDRQLAVLKLVAQGQSNREIAHALQLSEKTVGRHLENLFDRLSVSSRSAAAAWAVRAGLA